MEKALYQRNDTYILIPAYKPDHLMIELLQKLKKEDFDIVVVNDGSSEEYDPVFKEAEKYALVLKQNPNKGKGAALRLGFSYINLNAHNHNYVITCDADGQHLISDIIKINDKLHETNNVVLGSRKFDKSVPKRSRNGNFMSRLCRTLITKDYIGDDQCGLRGFPINMISNLVSLQGDHYEYEMNVVCTLQIRKLKIEEIPIQTIYLNNNSASHFRPNLDTFRIQRTIWINAAVPLLCALCSIAMLTIFSILLPTGNRYWPFLLSYLYFFEMWFGITALVWPTRKMGRRVLVEGIYATIKAAIVFGFFTLFFLVCHFYAVFAYTIALLLAFLCNFPLAYCAWKIKNRNTHK